MDNNSVTLHTDYIEVVWRGAQNVEKIRASNAQVVVVIKRLQSEHRPVHVLLQIVDHPDLPDMESLVEVITAIRANAIERLAVCGDVPTTVMPLVATVIATFNRQMEVKYIKNPYEALNWLKSDQPGNRDD